MTTQPGHQPPNPAWAVIAPDGTLTWHPATATPTVEETVGGRHGALDKATITGPLRLLASDVAAVFPGDYPENPVARDVLLVMSAGRIRQQWRGHVAITHYEQDGHTGELLWPGPLSAADMTAIRKLVTEAGGRETQPTSVTEYPSLEAFYAARPARDRRRSPEADYGVHWQAGGRAFPTWRVSYIKHTGEVYAARNDGGPVRVLGVVPPDPDHRFDPGGNIDGPTYYEKLNRVLEGWADPGVTGHDLAWITRRLAAHGYAR
jgi:hypothetical protein